MQQNKKLTQAEELEKMRNFTDELVKDPIRLKEFLRKIQGPPRRELKDKEYDQIWLLLQMLEPTRESNNQRTWTSEYALNGKQYHVTYGLEENPIIEEVDND